LSCRVGEHFHTNGKISNAVQDPTAELGVRGKIAEAADTESELTWNLSGFRTNLHDDIYGIATSVSPIPPASARRVFRRTARPSARASTTAS
jgi:hypothetical protein